MCARLCLVDVTVNEYETERKNERVRVSGRVKKICIVISLVYATYFMTSYVLHDPFNYKKKKFTVFNVSTN